MTKMEIAMFIILFIGTFTILALGADQGGTGSGIQEIPLWTK